MDPTTTGLPTLDAAGDFCGTAALVCNVIPSGGNSGFQAGLGTFGAGEMLAGGLRCPKLLEEFNKNKGVSKHYSGLELSREITRVISGIASTISNIWTLIVESIKKIGQAIVEAGKHIGTAATGVGVALYSLTAIPKIIQSVNAFTILDKLEKAENPVEVLRDIFTNSPNELKVAAPDLYEKLCTDVNITLEHVKEAKTECKSKGSIGVATVAMSVAAIVGTILAAVFTGGVGLIVAGIIGIVVSLALTVIDSKDLIDSLKKATKLTTKDLIIKVITVALAAIALVVSVVFAPTLALAIAGGVIGGIMMAIPIASIAYLKIKEERLKQAGTELH